MKTHESPDALMPAHDTSAFPIPMPTTASDLRIAPAPQPGEVAASEEAPAAVAAPQMQFYAPVPGSAGQFQPAASNPVQAPAADEGTDCVVDTAMIRSFLEKLFATEESLEVRVIGSKENDRACRSQVLPRNQISLIAPALRRMDYFRAVFVTLNPGIPCPPVDDTDVLFTNSVSLRQEAIKEHRWLLIDLDPARPTRTNSTDEEIKHARRLADEIIGYFSGKGWPLPLEVMSGNGWHLLYRIDLSKEETPWKRQLLHGLARRFNNEHVKVDTTVFDLSRLTKLPGTMVRKGENLPDRPHRMACFLTPDREVIVVPREARIAAFSDLDPTAKADGSRAQRESVASESETGAPAAVRHALVPNLPLPVLQPIVEGCAFIRHCHIDAASLPEPEWYAALSVVGRCENGAALAQAMSSPYPGYSPDETGTKLRHALVSAGPRTCQNIEDSLGFGGCATCPHRGRITSPIQLGRPARSGGEGAVDDGEQPQDASSGAVPVATQYFEQGGCLWKRNTDPDEAPLRLTNFTARILADRKVDDGAEFTREFEIEAVVAGQTLRVKVPAQQFTSMDWVPKQLGANAAIEAGYARKEMARCAIQAVSGLVPLEHLYSHTGWREIDGDWVFLHADGGIDQDGHAPGVGVFSGNDWRSRVRLELPESDEAEREAVRGCLELLEVAGDQAGVALLGAPLRAVLGDNEVSLHLEGTTGVFKSSLIALSQSFFGRGFDTRTLPGSWSSTANATEMDAFLAKDLVFVIDDYKPVGSRYDRDTMLRAADRLFRGQSNGQARQRLNKEAELRPPKPARAFIASTGEETPAGESLRARVLVIELKKGVVDVERLSRLQEMARQGVFATAMGGYIRWLAARYGQVKAEMPEAIARLRCTFQGEHRRTPNLMAHYQLGLEWFSHYAQEIGAMTAEEGQAFRERCRAALEAMGAEQGTAQVEGSPAQRFIHALKEEYLAQRIRFEMGAFVRYAHYGMGNAHRNDEALTVGEIQDSCLFLRQEYAKTLASKLGIDDRALGRSLLEAGFLARREENRGVYTVRKVINRTEVNVYVLKGEVIWSDKGTSR
jgi:hypothetical protein